MDELNAEVENEDDREIYTIFEDNDFIEERNRILNEGNIGDIIEYWNSLINIFNFIRTIVLIP